MNIDIILNNCGLFTFRIQGYKLHRLCAKFGKKAKKDRKIAKKAEK